VRKDLQFTYESFKLLPVGKIAKKKNGLKECVFC